MENNRIGADIIMALDDVIKTTVTGPRVEEAMYRTLRWIDRCIEAHKRPHDQNLFGIVQGGLDPRLRDICVQGLVERNLPGDDDRRRRDKLTNQIHSAKSSNEVRVKGGLIL
ncbi:uncharacterized protein [Cicer arietinum]|uniref:uncharacterized protein isoform X2 n=1 Tax=Cicer arietinum TaxID=3827 RepID=UPI003CC5AF74